MNMRISRTIGGQCFELADLSQELKARDPLMNMRISKTIGGQCFTGQVEDIEVGNVFGERFYRVRYCDGDLEHLTAMQVKEFQDKALEILATVRCVSGEVIFGPCALAGHTSIGELGEEVLAVTAKTRPHVLAVKLSHGAEVLSAFLRLEQVAEADQIDLLAVFESETEIDIGPIVRICTRFGTDFDSSLLESPGALVTMRSGSPFDMFSKWMQELGLGTFSLSFQNHLGDSSCEASHLSLRDKVDVPCLEYDMDSQLSSYRGGIQVVISERVWDVSVDLDEAMLFEEMNGYDSPGYDDNLW